MTAPTTITNIGSYAGLHGGTANFMLGVPYTPAPSYMTPIATLFHDRVVRDIYMEPVPAKRVYWSSASSGYYNMFGVLNYSAFGPTAGFGYPVADWDRLVNLTNTPYANAYTLPTSWPEAYAPIEAPKTVRLLFVFQYTGRPINYTWPHDCLIKYVGYNTASNVYTCDVSAGDTYTDSGTHYLGQEAFVVTTEHPGLQIFDEFSRAPRIDNWTAVASEVAMQVATLYGKEIGVLLYAIPADTAPLDCLLGTYPARAPYSNPNGSPSQVVLLSSTEASSFQTLLPSTALTTTALASPLLTMLPQHAQDLIGCVCPRGYTISPIWTPSISDLPPPITSLPSYTSVMTYTNTDTPGWDADFIGGNVLNIIAYANLGVGGWQYKFCTMDMLGSVLDPIFTAAGTNRPAMTYTTTVTTLLGPVPSVTTLTTTPANMYFGIPNWEKQPAGYPGYGAISRGQWDTYFNLSFLPTGAFAINSIISYLNNDFATIVTTEFQHRVDMLAYTHAGFAKHKTHILYDTDAPMSAEGMGSPFFHFDCSSWVPNGPLSMQGPGAASVITNVDRQSVTYRNFFKTGGTFTVGPYTGNPVFWGYFSQDAEQVAVNVHDTIKTLSQEYVDTLCTSLSSYGYVYEGSVSGSDTSGVVAQIMTIIRSHFG